VVRRLGGGLEVVDLEEVAPGRYRTAFRPTRPGSYTYGLRLALLHPVTGRVEWVRWA